MRLLHKLRIWFALVFALTGSLYFLVQQFVLTPTFEEIEHREASRNLRLIHGSFSEQFKDLLRIGSDYAHRDQTWESLNRQVNPEYSTIVLLDTNYSNLRLNLLAYYDRKNRQVWGHTLDLETYTLGVFDDSDGLLWDAVQKLLKSAQTTGASWGLARSQDGAVLLGAVAVLKSDLSGPSSGTVLVGRRLSPRLLQNIQNEVEQDFRIELFDKGSYDTSLVKRVEAKDKRGLLIKHSSEMMTGYLLWRDLQNNPYMLLRMDKPRETTLKGSSAMHTAFWILLFGVAMLLLILENVLRFQVLGPLEELTGMMRKVQTGKGSLKKFHYKPRGSDEIGRLAGEFSAMLGRLNQAIASERDAKEEARKLAELAESANQIKSEFLANMSHELRTPLNAIIGFSSLLQKTDQDEEHQEYLRIIADNGHTLMNLLNDILDLSKIEAGRLTINPQSLHLEDLVRQIHSTFRLQADAKGLDLEIVLDENIPLWVEMDDVRIRQVLNNLIGNAVKFTEHGYVRVRIRSGHIPQENPGNAKHAMLFFDVQDSGIGISAEFQNQVFDPFAQERMRDPYRFGGTGLGLAISRKLMRLMNGDVKLVSTGNEGSHFEVSVPVRLVQREQRSDQGDLPPVSGNLQGRKILVVDDLAENRLLLRTLLQESKMEVLEASNGLEAIRKWEEFHPEFVIMDMRMPEMDGFEATSRIRDLEKSKGGIRKSVIIALTAFAMKEDTEEMLTLGCDEVLTKPLNVAKLEQALHKHLT